MQFYYLALFFLFFIILLAFLLLAPFHLSLNIGKKGPLIKGSIRLTWLGLTLMKAEISPQSAGDLLASTWEEASGREDRTHEVRKSDEKEMGREAKQEERSEVDNQKTGAVRPPSIQSLINAAPALAKILRSHAHPSISLKSNLISLSRSPWITAKTAHHSLASISAMSSPSSRSPSNHGSMKIFD